VTLAISLAWNTPSSWADAALEQPLALLSDHAYCELGAAASAHGLIARTPTWSRLVDGLAALAGEEMRHFRQVHAQLLRMGGELEPVRRNAYTAGLLRVTRRGTGALLDRLLVAGLIERRSLERFELLAAAAASPLRELYERLGPSEAGHAVFFVERACELAPEAVVAERLRELAACEGRLVAGLPFAPRIHAGPPALQAAAGVAETVSPGRAHDEPSALNP